MINRIQNVQVAQNTMQASKLQQPAFGKGEHTIKSALTGMSTTYDMTKIIESNNLSHILYYVDKFTKDTSKNIGDIAHEPFKLKSSEGIKLEYRPNQDSIHFIKYDAAGNFQERMTFDSSDHKDPSNQFSTIPETFEKIKNAIIKKAQ